MLVSGIDWHGASDRIVTVSHDRNAFVWALDAASGEWVPTVVILHVDRAALDVEWSADGAKFAVASGNKNLMICTYDAANNWWVGNPCKREKKVTTAKSSVVAVAWHPCSQVVACASTDWKARVLFTYTEGVDAAPDGGPFGADHAYGDVIVEYEQTRAWVNDVAWSPAGDSLAWVAHDGLLHVVSFASSDGAVKVHIATWRRGVHRCRPHPARRPRAQTVKTASLPAARVMWLTETALVTAGHNLAPELFALGPTGAWAFVTNIDKKVATSAAAAPAASAAGGHRVSVSFGAAKAMFGGRAGAAADGGDGAAAAAGGAGAGAGASSSAASATRHTGCITCIQPHTSTSACPRPRQRVLCAATSILTRMHARRRAQARASSSSRRRASTAALSCGMCWRCRASTRRRWASSEGVRNGAQRRAPPFNVPPQP